MKTRDEYLTLFKAQMDIPALNQVSNISTRVAQRLAADLDLELCVFTAGADYTVVNIAIAKVRQYNDMWNSLIGDIPQLRRDGFKLAVKTSILQDPDHILYRGVSFL